MTSTAAEELAMGNVDVALSMSLLSEVYGKGLYDVSVDHELAELWSGWQLKCNR